MRQKLIDLNNIVLTSHLVCLFVFFLTYLTSAVVESKESYFDILAINSEFSFGRVASVHQGSKILWVGSENGLVGILGKEELRFKKLNLAIGSNKILSLFELNPNLLIISTLGKGIFTLNLDDLNFKQITGNDGIGSSICVSIHKISASKVLLNCRKSIFSLDVNSSKISNLLSHLDESLFNEEFIQSVAIDSSGIIWLAYGDDGLYSFSTHQKPSIIPLHLTGISANSLFIDSANRLWVGSKSGIYRIEANREKSQFFKLSDNWHFHENRIRAMFEDSKGDIWVSSQELFLFDEEKNIFNLAENKIPMLKDSQSLLINSIDEASSGEIVFGSDVNGLLAVPKLAASFSILTDDKGENFGTIEESKLLDSGQVLIKGRESFYEWREGKNIKWIANHKSFVTAIEQIDDKSLIFASDGIGISKLDLDSNEIKTLTVPALPSPERSSIYSLDKYLDNKLLVSVFGQERPGLYLVNGNSHSSLITNQQVDTAIVLNSDQIVAAVRDVGILFFSDVNNYYKLITETDGKPVDCIEQFDDEKIWFCSPSFGLGYHDLDKDKFIIIDSQFLKNSLYIRDILADSDNNIWVMTNSGLIRINKTLDTSYEFGIEDGIIEKDFSYTASIRLSGNKILVAGDKFNYVINTKIANEYIQNRTKKFTFASIISGKVFEQNQPQNYTRLVNYLDEPMKERILTLDSEEYLVILKFVANNFIDRNILAFEYRLLGLDDAWFSTSPSESTATYSTLPPGDYTFQVRVKDHKSSVVQPISSLKLIVLPPFWQTWQAYFIYSILAIILLFIILKYRTLHLSRVNKKLEVAVLDRTNELAKSESKITALLKQKESLFAHASHEIRTPLSLILGPLQKLGLSLKDKNQIKQFELISRNTKRLTVLVDQILELEKLDSAKNTRLKNYSIGKSLASLVAAFQPIAELKSQQLILHELHDGVARLTEDSLEKVISNLLINAVKYCPNGSKIEIFTSLNAGQYIIKIVDNGPGIPVSEQAKIFERFVRTQTSASSSGTGLGLAVVKELLIANGASISLDSKQGVGTTFTIQLPLSNEDVVAESSFDYATTDIAGIADEINQKRYQVSADNIKETTNDTILIIEDNADMRLFLTDLLADQYSCIEAVNGLDGLSKAVEFLPDLIITDLMMPLSDGFELTDNIRSNELTAHIPIILLTAKGDDSSRMEGWKKAVDDYIAKPFNNDELILRIANLLSIRKIIARKFGVAISDEDTSALTQLNLSDYYSDRDKKFFDKFIGVIEQHYQDESFNRGIASDLMCVSERQLNRKLNALIDFNFSDYLRKFRLVKAKKELEKGGQITEVAYNVGFSAPSYFSHCFKAEFGLSPKAFVDNLKNK